MKKPILNANDFFILNEFTIVDSSNRIGKNEVSFILYPPLKGTRISKDANNRGVIMDFYGIEYEFLMSEKEYDELYKKFKK